MNDVMFSLGQLIPMGKDPASRGKTPIFWRVLAFDGNRILVISDRVLKEMKPLQKAQNEKPWEKDYYCNFNYKWSGCDIYKYLNGKFLKEYGLDEYNIVNVPHETAGTDFTEDETTEEGIFLLSEDEAERYFKSSDRIAADLDGRISAWALRSPSRENCFSTMKVATTGFVIPTGIPVSLPIGIRPAFWVAPKNYS